MILEKPLLGILELQSIVRGEWVTLGLAAATALSIRRGGTRSGSGVGVRTDVGLMTFTLLDVRDPLRSDGLTPGQDVRCVMVDQEQHPLFTGRISDIAADYPLNKTNGTMRSRTTITVADAVQIHATTPRYGVRIATGYETFESRISRLASSALAPIEPPLEGAPREVYAF